MKIKCQHKRRQSESYRATSIEWKAAFPFFVNPRGVLVHWLKVFIE